MLKVLKNLKHTWIQVVIIVILLCVQAATDLTLPDYTSKIVNEGIQQGGIVNIAPDAMRKSTMENLLIFTKEDDEILKNYILVSKNNKEYEEYLKKYPLLEKEDLYVVKKLNKTEQEELDTVISKPFMMLYYLTQGEMEQKVKAQIMAELPEQQKQVMQEMNLIDIIKNMSVVQHRTAQKKDRQALPQSIGHVVCFCSPLMFSLFSVICTV